MRLSYLTCGDRFAEPPLLLLHGTFWSRVWAPVLPALGQHFRCVALDLPGFGRSAGERTIPQASVPALADTVAHAADALGLQSFHLAGHDIGGGIAQQLTVTSGRVARLVLMNAVMLGSWPVPAVERFRDPHVRAATAVEQLLEARAESARRAVARPPPVRSPTPSSATSPSDRDSVIAPTRPRQRCSNARGSPSSECHG